MAGRPKKSTMFTDIVDISSTEEKSEPNVSKTSKKLAEIAPEPSSRFGTVKTESPSNWLNVRRGPGASFDVVSTLKNGEKVTIYKEENGFGKISDVSDMWVSLNYIV